MNDNPRYSEGILNEDRLSGNREVQANENAHNAF